MHSQAYLAARKEFANCMWMSIIGFGVPVVIAFREWWPIMRAEKQKEALNAAESAKLQG